MRGVHFSLIIGIASATAGAVVFLTPSNIDPDHKFSWSENAGWMNWLDADGGKAGVVVGDDFLSGHVWMENVGYLNVGDGSGPYTNVDGGSFGVNVLGNGDLEGLAWGENIGWVNFGWAANSADVNRARYDSAARRFRGYAWAENIGWINLDDATHYVGVATPTPPDPGIGDDVCSGGSNDGGSCSTDGDCPGGSCGLKSRYITITTPVTSDPFSIQVTIVSMPLDPSREGDVWWAGPSQAVPNAPDPDLIGAGLLCEPTPSNVEVWPAGAVHLFGPVIVPGAVYEVRLCDSSGANCSNPLLVGTGKWGDVTAPYGGAAQPNFADINAVVNKFQSLAGAPDMTRADLVGGGGPDVPNTANQVANFADINADVTAFQGQPYPYPIEACP